LLSRVSEKIQISKSETINTFYNKIQKKSIATRLDLDISNLFYPEKIQNLKS